MNQSKVEHNGTPYVRPCLRYKNSTYSSVAIKGINPGLPCEGQDSTTELLLLNSPKIHEGPPKLWSAKTSRFDPLDIQTSLPKNAQK